MKNRKMVFRIEYELRIFKEFLNEIKFFKTYDNLIELNQKIDEELSENTSIKYKIEKVYFKQLITVR